MVDALLVQRADTVDIISMTEKDRMMGVDLDDFRGALHIVRKAHEVIEMGRTPGADEEYLKEALQVMGQARYIRIADG